MKAMFFKGVVLGAMVASLTVVATAAVAGTSVGGVFNLGKTNSVNGSTVLSGSTNGQQLKVVNTNTGSSAAGIGIQTATNKPPLVVNSTTKIAHLNADLVDGQHSNAFVQGHGSVHGGAFTIPKGSSTGLGPVGSLGSLTARCGTNGFTDAGVLFTTSQAEEGAILGAAQTGPTHLVFNAGGEAANLGDRASELATLEVWAGNEVAVATLVWGDTTSDCRFSVQVTDSNG